jgi:hypothetical protein
MSSAVNTWAVGKMVERSYVTEISGLLGLSAKG